MIYPMLPPKFEQEVEVQVYYSQILSQLIKCSFSARFRTDGIFYNKENSIKILAEFKVGGDLSSDNDLFIRCIIQILCYIKKIEDSGEMLPNIIFISNENHFAIFDSNILNNYLKYVDSNMAPSTMFATPPKYLKDLLLKEISIKKYRRSDLSFLKSLIRNFKNKSIGLKMSINNNNITRIFEDFITSNILNEKLSENEKVALFTSIIFDECNDIIGKPNQIVTPLSKKKVVKINRENYDIFLSIIKSINKPSSKSEIISQTDRLIEEVSRRFHGEFYTPKIWVDEAHKMIEKQFGIDWKDKYVVWDPACGTGNLTRDYQFKELYCSTLFSSDIDIMKKRGYKGVKFQYDFLNDDVYSNGVIDPLKENKLTKVAPGLVKAFEEKRDIIIIKNPPFGRPTGGKINFETINSTKNKIKLLMSGLGNSSNLYIQFLYRSMLFAKQNKNVNICSFSRASFLSINTFSKFREIFFKKLKLDNGMLFSAKNFVGVNGDWACLFAIYSPGKNLYIPKLKLKQKVNNNIKIIGEKKIYNINKSARDWAKIDLKYTQNYEVPALTSALKLYQKNDIKTKGFTGQIGCLFSDGNVVARNSEYVAIFSTTNNYGSFSIMPQNFYGCCSYFTARKVIIPSWITYADEYEEPNIDHLDYNQWNIDCIIYSLFNGSSQQSSLRNIPYKNKNWNIENQFFWIPNQLMKQLADDNGFDELYQDTIVFNQERFVYKELQKVQLSPDAIEVLNKANDLVVKSFPERKRLHNLHPEWHLNAWDVGWYQIKKVLNDCMKDDLKEFNILYKKFENRMREGVYKFGFLK